MPIGSMLDGMDQQYVAAKDERGTWRILNTWHEDLKLLDPDSEVPDDSEAVKILTEGEFIALVKEASRTGVLENASFGADTSEYESIIQEKDDEIRRLQSSPIEDTSKYSEDYKLKEKAMESILKMVSMSDLANLTNSKD